MPVSADRDQSKLGPVQLRVGLDQLPQIGTVCTREQDVITDCFCEAAQRSFGTDPHIHLKIMHTHPCPHAAVATSDRCSGTMQ